MPVRRAISVPRDHEHFRLLTAYPFVRSVKPIEGAPAGRTATSIVMTGRNSWAETDLKRMTTEGRPSRNRQGRRPRTDFARRRGQRAGRRRDTASAGRRARSRIPNKPETRLVVVGDSDFAANSVAGIPGNQDMFLNIGELAGAAGNLISVRPRNPEDRRITMTAGQDRMIFWFTIAGSARADLPGGHSDLVAEALRCGASVVSCSCSSSPPASAAICISSSRSATRRTRTKKEKVFTVESDKIDEMTIKSESGERTTLKKTGTDWQIVAPVTAPPDGAAVSGLTSNLSTLEIQRVIDDNPQDVAEYGLTQPRIEVTFKAGGKEQRLQIGRKTPRGDRLLREDRRSEARIPDPLLRRHDVQQDHVRPA